MRLGPGVSVRTLWRAALALAFAGAIAGCAASTLPRVEGEANTLATARQLIDRRDFLAAVELLRGYVDRNAGREDVDEAVFLLGEAHLKAREPALAQIEFERLLRDYPESDSSGAAAFALGEALEAQSRGEDFDQEFTLRALNQFQRFQRDHPGHTRAADAENKTATLRAKLGRKLLNTGSLYVALRRGEAARIYFQRVLDDYSDTPLTGEALIGLAWCDALAGRKAEAVAALRELESRFAGQPLARTAAAERRRIERLRPPERRGTAREAQEAAVQP